ncbi:MAG: hypothetical protein B7Y80_06995 [Hyphomicrobium sp. 32-62-53]|nr:MAG: hypothetical protein B7Y80_06995 [Hyphomicrobium sp. 32-62-53]
MTKSKTMQKVAGTSGPSGQSASDASMAATRMAYMADLLLELEGMASAEGHATLAGLLALAHAEAVAKSR